MKSLTNPLKWEVVEAPIFSKNQKIEGYKGIFRSDNGKMLSVCKNTYTPTQNEKFLEITQKLHEITGFPIKNICEVEGGKKTLAFLECTEKIKVCGFDFDDYLMLGNSHDGSTPFFMGNSSIMARCNNRFSKEFRQMKAYHTKTNELKIDQLVKYFDLFMSERNNIFSNMDKFSNVKIDKSIKVALMQRLTNMNQEEKVSNEISTRKINLINSIDESIERECSALGDNAFGLFNGITHYTTHVKKTKNEVFGNPFGSQNDYNQKAYNFCLELV